MIVDKEVNEYSFPEKSGKLEWLCLASAEETEISRLLTQR